MKESAFTAKASPPNNYVNVNGLVANKVVSSPSNATKREHVSSTVVNEAPEPLKIKYSTREIDNEVFEASGVKG